LAVTIGNTHNITIHNRKVLYAFAHKTLGAPASNTSNAKDDDTLFPDALHYILAKQKLCPIEK
jgi:hypothetical protein